MLNELPPEILDRFTTYVNPTLLLYGIIQVSAKDVMIEMELGKLKKEKLAEQRLGVSRPGPVVVPEEVPVITPVSEDL